MTIGTCACVCVCVCVCVYFSETVGRFSHLLSRVCLCELVVSALTSRDTLITSDIDIDRPALSCVPTSCSEQLHPGCGVYERRVCPHGLGVLPSADVCCSRRRQSNRRRKGVLRSRHQPPAVHDERHHSRGRARRATSGSCGSESTGL